jgi:hypothetical protein
MMSDRAFRTWRVIMLFNGASLVAILYGRAGGSIPASAIISGRWQRQPFAGV